MGKFLIEFHSHPQPHYDLRLELDGVYKSWVVKKEIPLERGIRRLAVQVEDHPLDYQCAEAKEIWDEGEYQIESRKEQKIVFLPQGKKFSGRYTLLQTQWDEKQWLLFRCSATDKKDPSQLDSQ